MTEHNHSEFVPGCFRCDLSRVELSDAEIIARYFHTYYERIAPDLGYKTRPESAVEWEHIPELNRKVMVAVVEQLLEDCVIDVGIATVYVAEGEPDD